MQEKYEYAAAYYTDAGEKFNEDAAYVDAADKTFVAVVADGVGGARNGDEASLFITRSVKRWFEELTMTMREMSMEDMADSMKICADTIHEELLDIAEETKKEFGSTMTFAMIGKQRYSIIHIGDSRAYLYDRDKRWVTQLTKDQTVAEYERETGKTIPLEECRKEHVLMQCMGRGSIATRYYEGNLPDNFDFLICSDGLSNTLREWDIKKELQKRGSGKDALIRLTSSARERGEKDNITSILIRRRKA